MEKKEQQYILVAKTVEEAMAEARDKYGAADMELSFTILEMPKKGFLGIGATPAKVQVTVTKALEDVNLSDIVADMRRGRREESAKADKFDRGAKNTRTEKYEKHDKHEKNNRDERPEQGRKPVVGETPAALRQPVKGEGKNPKKPQKNSRPAPKNTPADNRSGEEKKKDLLSAVMNVKTAAPTAEAKAEAATPAVAPTEKAETPAATESPRVEFVTPEEMQYALDFANMIMKNMGLSGRAVHNPDALGEEIPEGMVAARIEIEGDESGILIGYHGETLDAIQYLTNLCASRKSASAKREFVKIVIDVEGYRAKREATLRALARRMAAKAIKYRRNMVLEPMNPYERRIIHSEVQSIENVATHSVGSDENRKIVITYEGADKAPRNDRRRPRNDRGERGEKSNPHREKRADAPAEDGDPTAPRAEKPIRVERAPRTKPVRAKSIDDVRLDLSEESTVTLGSLGESVDTYAPFDGYADSDASEESLREY